MPASSAARTHPVTSSCSTLEPNVSHEPSTTSLTRTPLRPSRRCSMPRDGIAWRVARRDRDDVEPRPEDAHEHRVDPYRHEEVGAREEPDERDAGDRRRRPHEDATVAEAVDAASPEHGGEDADDPAERLLQHDLRLAH